MTARKPGAATLLAIALLSGCPEPASTPTSIVDEFYGRRLALEVAGAPEAEELEALKPYLATELQELLGQAQLRVEQLTEDGEILTLSPPT